MSFTYKNKKFGKSRLSGNKSIIPSVFEDKKSARGKIIVYPELDIEFMQRVFT